MKTITLTLNLPTMRDVYRKANRIKSKWQNLFTSLFKLDNLKDEMQEALECYIEREVNRQIEDYDFEDSVDSYFNNNIDIDDMVGDALTNRDIEYDTIESIKDSIEEIECELRLKVYTEDAERIAKLTYKRLYTHIYNLREEVERLEERLRKIEQHLLNPKAELKEESEMDFDTSHNAWHEIEELGKIELDKIEEQLGKSK